MIFAWWMRWTAHSEAAARSARLIPTEDPQLEPPPIIDDAYLEDMRQWVGDATLLSLLATAPESFTGELAAIQAAWQSGDLAAVHETAHRLKGAAGSVGCRRLAETAHRMQKLTQAEFGEARHLDQLIAEVTTAKIEVSQWSPAQTVE